MVSHLPNGDYQAARPPHPTAAKAARNDELTAMLASIRTNSAAELNNISAATIWPDIERAVIALNDADPRRRGDAIDQLLDAMLRAVETTHQRMLACDAWARDHDSE